MVDLQTELGCVEMELVARRRAITRHPAVLEFWQSLMDMADSRRLAGRLAEQTSLQPKRPGHSES